MSSRIRAASMGLLAATMALAAGGVTVASATEAGAAAMRTAYRIPGSRVSSPAHAATAAVTVEKLVKTRFTFKPTKLVQTYTVPPGVTGFEATVVGASGGNGYAIGTNTAGKGGFGSKIEKTFFGLKGGDTIAIVVGSAGGTGTQTQGGSGGLGLGAGGAGGKGGGGGGGATQVSAPDSTFVLAGGGGGGAGATAGRVGESGQGGGPSKGGNGGTGGSTPAAGGSAIQEPSTTTTAGGGGAGTTAAFGAGGAAAEYTPSSDSGDPGKAGTKTVGGAGGTGQLGGGGGGAGLRAGGGGGGAPFQGGTCTVLRINYICFGAGAGGGGGAGSNYAQDATITTGTSKTGWVTIAYMAVSPSIFSTPATTFVAGKENSFQVTVSATPTATVTETGKLPSGISLSSTGKLSGEPAAGTGGTYAFTIKATNGITPPATQKFTLTVDQAPTITTPDEQIRTAEHDEGFKLEATGYPTSMTFTETGALPEGLTLASTGTLDGTPATGTEGTYSVTVMATNGITPPAHQAFTVKVVHSPTITSADSAVFGVDDPGSFQVTTATTATAPATIRAWTLSNATKPATLPSGVTLSTTGKLSGTPTGGTAGTYSFWIRAGNGGETVGVQKFTLVVEGVPVITNVTPTSGYISGGTEVTITGTNLTGTYSVTFGGVEGTTIHVIAPTKLTVVTPPTRTPGFVTVQLTDPGGGANMAKAFQYVLAPLAISTTSLPGGTVGVAYSTTLASSGGTGLYHRWKETGLPAGLELTAVTGAISGTPTTAGTSTVHVTVEDGILQTVSKTFTFVVSPAPAPSSGYWTVASDGGIFSYGDAHFYGSMGGIPLNKPVVGMAATETGNGYWEVASDGGIFSFGTASFHGSMGGKPLNAPIVGMALDSATGGYWEVAADGGIFAFTAPFYGSMGGKPLNQPIVGMASTPTGGGYWLVASDGGIFSYGNAHFYGSMGGKPLNKPVVGMSATKTGKGYWEVASDGGIFSFGTASFHGSMGGKPLNKPMVGMALTSVTGGYRTVASDGGMFSFDAPFYGSMGGKPLNKPMVGMAIP